MVLDISIQDPSEYFRITYPELYPVQMNHLRNLLTQYETGYEMFTAIPIEAGIGKSQESDKSIGQYRKNGGNRSFLLVKKFRPEVTNSLIQINSHCGSNIALAITSNNWGEIRSQVYNIVNWPVVIITHARYLNLSLDPLTRSYFEQDRHTLVIDEQVELPTSLFSEHDYLAISDQLDSAWLRDRLSRLCKGLLEQATYAKALPNTILSCRPQVDLELLHEFTECLIVNKALVKNLSAIKRFISDVSVLGTSLCFCNQGRITAVDNRIKLWGLQNNIILDASAEVDQRYKYSSNITVDIQPKIIPNYKSILHVSKFNTSQSGIQNTLDFSQKVCKAIRERKSEVDKTLVVVHKSREADIVACLEQERFTDIGIGDNFHGQDIAVAHFGNLIGKNHWKDFNQVWIVATNILPMEMYPVYQSFFSGEKPLNQEIPMSRVPGGYGFLDEHLENIRIGCIASDIYQAIQRVDRLGKRGSEIFLVQSNQRVIDKVIEQLPGIRLGEQFDLGIRNKNGQRKETRTDVMAAEMAALLWKNPPSNYEKKYLCKLLGWDNNPNLNRIWRHNLLKEMEEANIIEIGWTNVIRL